MALIQTRFTVWGLNPNDVATFIVVLILSLPVLLRWSKHLSWLVWPSGALLIALLVGTGSRGGVLALFCGGLVWAILCGRRRLLPDNWKIWSGVVLIVVVGLGAGLTAFPKGFRLGTVDVSPEASAGRRLEVWSTVPAMFASAPNGWGLGNAASAYEQWYEPVDEDVVLKHLLSSHLTWLVEFGWPLRWAYLFLWMAVMVLLLPSRRFDFPFWGVAVWTAFFVALFYNAAGKEWNWPIPLLWLLMAIILRWKQKVFPSWWYWMMSALVSAILVGLPFVCSWAYPSQTPIQTWDGGNIVLIGKGKPSVAILSPSKDVLGNFYGHEIRRASFGGSPKEGSVVIVGQPDAAAIPCLAACRLFVISGGDEMALYKWRLIFTPKFESKLLLINCRVPIDDWVKVFSRVVYAHGEFYGDSHYREWKDFSAVNPAVSVKDIPGRETYIADWWPLLDEAGAK